jgi:hypothetical protein
MKNLDMKSVIIGMLSCACMFLIMGQTSSPLNGEFDNITAQTITIKNNGRTLRLGVLTLDDKFGISMSNSNAKKLTVSVWDANENTLSFGNEDIITTINAGSIGITELSKKEGTTELSILNSKSLTLGTGNGRVVVLANGNGSPKGLTILDQNHIDRVGLWLSSDMGALVIKNNDSKTASALMQGSDGYGALMLFDKNGELGVELNGVK